MTWMLLIVFFIGFWIGFLAACLFAAAGRADDRIERAEICNACRNEILRSVREGYVSTGHENIGAQN